MDSDKKIEQLKNNSDYYRYQMEEELDEIMDEAQKWGKRALIIGGVVLTAYMTYKLVKGGDEESEEKELRAGIINSKNKDHENKFSIWNALKYQAAIFAIGLAKEKLNSFLHHSPDDIQETETENTNE
ncbi:hypothetical protein [Marinigracilibium pacificum]|uniref:Uncharacterized protein n=1 Tax=Marinigracilibium pacificum TaxID=2729599 RepID=A0A848IYI4_9BACT|nr:hypothetical protein [Marinigracilibium pacificum]NMM47049.1 hypothetical protein [Marinigracilibium pacificum]